MSGRPRLELERVYDATPEEVYAAWTDADALRTWMCPGNVLETRAELDVRVGGRFVITMRTADGDVVHEGHYLELRAAERLVFTWSSRHTRHVATRVTVDLEAVAPGRTRLRLVHEALPDDDAMDKHRAGWTDILAGLPAWLDGSQRP